MQTEEECMFLIMLFYVWDNTEEDRWSLFSQIIIFKPFFIKKKQKKNE